MKFDSETNKHLKGELFSEGLEIPFIAEKYPNQTRIEKILELTTGKRVISAKLIDLYSQYV